MLKFRILREVLLLNIIFTLCFVAYADNAIKVTIDGKLLVTDAPAVIIDSRTLVPFRAIFEAMGAAVEWDGANRVVTAKKADSVIILKIDDKNPTVNGQQQELDVPALIINDRAMVPVRFIASSLGADVGWDEKSLAVSITTQKSVEFKDRNFEQAVRDAINKPQGILTNTDLMRITSLDASDRGIESVEGIENIRALTEIDLSQNKLVDISPMKDLQHLTRLNIANNNIAGIKAINKLSALKELNIQFNPIKNLTEISDASKKMNVYLVDDKIPVNNVNKEYMIKYEQIMKKASEIAGRIVVGDMSDLDKELAVNDYLCVNLQHTDQNFADVEHPDYLDSVYDAFMTGKSDCAGYAKATEIILNKAGIKCRTVNGFKYGDAGASAAYIWNIVKITGRYYHLDSFANDAADNNQGLNHTFFNLSDKQMAANCGWIRAEYPPCSDDNKDIDSQMKLRKTTVYDKNNIYRIINGNLYSINLKTNTPSKLKDDQSREIQASGDWIYYINDSDQQRIYKIKKDGTDREPICDASVSHMTISGGLIYYIDTQDQRVYNIDLSRLGATPQMADDIASVCYDIFSVDDWVYYRLNVGFGRIRNDDQTDRRILYDKLLSVAASDNNAYERLSGSYLYYVNVSDGNKIYRVRLDGSESSCVSDDFMNTYNFEIVGDYLYYTIQGDMNQTYRIKTDGGQREAVQ